VASDPVRLERDAPAGKEDEGAEAARVADVAASSWAARNAAAQPGRHEYPTDRYVFGDVTGERIRSVKTAWANTLLKAHGIEPAREKNGRLTAECQHELANIDLNFHDLRREAGSRLQEGGVPLNIIQAFIDHANISTTSRYLKITQQGMHAALNRFEEDRGRTLQACCKPVRRCTRDGFSGDL
jgi:integrase